MGIVSLAMRLQDTYDSGKIKVHSAYETSKEKIGTAYNANRKKIGSAYADMEERKMNTIEKIVTYTLALGIGFGAGYAVKDRAAGNGRFDYVTRDGVVMYQDNEAKYEAPAARVGKSDKALMNLLREFNEEETSSKSSSKGGIEERIIEKLAK